MPFICNFCNNTFTLKHHLQRHIVDDRCKSELIKDMNKINNIIHEQKKEIDKLSQKEPVEIEQIIEVEQTVEITKLQLDGIFQGRESEIRITPDKRISVFNFIKVVGGQANPRETWNRILNEHNDELFGKTLKSLIVFY